MRGCFFSWQALKWATLIFKLVGPLAVWDWRQKNTTKPWKFQPLPPRYPWNDSGKISFTMYYENWYCLLMKSYKFTAYFENEVLRKRSYLKKEWCIRVLESPVKVEKQEHNRYRFWARIDELDGRFLRVITLEDKTTIHNAFPDRRFNPWKLLTIRILIPCISTLEPKAAQKAWKCHRESF